MAYKYHKEMMQRTLKRELHMGMTPVRVKRKRSVIIGPDPMFTDLPSVCHSAPQHSDPWGSAGRGGWGEVVRELISRLYALLACTPVKGSATCRARALSHSIDALSRSTIAQYWCLTYGLLFDQQAPPQCTYI